MQVTRIDILKTQDNLNEHIAEHGCSDLDCPTRYALWLALVDASWNWGRDVEYELAA